VPQGRCGEVVLGGVAPSVYVAKIAGDLGRILERSICPRSLFSDDYAVFALERAQWLKERADSLIDRIIL
jgi:hypothetical protein